jgi:predicted dehydrogenase
MSQPLAFGLVGAGSIAPAYVDALEGSPTCRLVGVADLRPDAAQALALRAGCPAFGSHQALLEACRLDAVIVCTPPATHPALACCFLERGVHTLCEKPLAIDVESASLMVEAARRHGVTLTMGSKFRYVDDVVKAKAIVTSGILGEIILFENAFTSRVDMRGRWNADPRVSGGGVLIDNGAHAVDLMRYFLGPLGEVQVVEGKRVQGLPVEDTVRIFVRSLSGVMGSIDLSWSINKELDSYINIYGSRGTIAVGWQASKYRQSTSPDWVVFGGGYSKVQAFRNQIRNFSRAIRGEEALLITAEDALASVQVIEAAYSALRQEPWIPVAAAGRGAPAVAATS